MAKKSASSKPVKKTAAKKAVKKTVSQTAAKAPVVAQTADPAKKSVRKSASTVRKPKTTPSKVTPPSPPTTIIAKVDVGFGHILYLRGEGGGLSWEQGVPLNCVNSDEWTWTSGTVGPEGVTFKFLIDDREWSQGEDLYVASGGTSVSAPVF